MVPNKLPETHKEPTEEMRREVALKHVRTGLYLAVERLNQFVAGKEHSEIIKRLHTAKTEYTGADGESQTDDYFSLWTDFADMRLTTSGKLLRSDDYEGRRTDILNGSDKSHEVTFKDLATDTETYASIQLTSLTQTLDKFLRPKAD